MMVIPIITYRATSWDKSSKLQEQHGESAETVVCLYERCNEDLSYISTRSYSCANTATFDYWHIIKENNTENEDRKLIIKSNSIQQAFRDDLEKKFRFDKYFKFELSTNRV